MKLLEYGNCWNLILLSETGRGEFASVTHSIDIPGPSYNGVDLNDELRNRTRRFTFQNIYGDAGKTSNRCSRGVPVFAPNKRFISNIVRRSEVIRTLHLISHLMFDRLGLLAVTYFLDLVRWE